MQIEWPEYGHWDEQEQKDVVRHHRIIILYGHHRHHHHQCQQITEIDLVQIQAWQACKEQNQIYDHYG